MFSTDITPNKFGKKTHSIKIDSVFKIYLHETNKSYNYLFEFAGKKIFREKVYLSDTLIGRLTDAADEALARAYLSFKRSKIPIDDDMWDNFESKTLQSIEQYENFKYQHIKDKKTIDFIERWREIERPIEDEDLSIKIGVFINDFYLRDHIDPEKFMQNYDILRNNAYKRVENDYGTPSIKDIYYTPQAFDDLFTAGYPDVYKWFQENAPLDRVEIQNKIEKLPDEEIEEYMTDFFRLMDYYDGIIAQYKREGNILECKLF